MTNRVMHFEIPAKNPAKLKNFYSKVFNWKFQKWKGPMDYWMIITGDKKKPGINGGMQKKGGNVTKVVNMLEVKNLNSSIEKIKKAGGKMKTKKLPVQGMGWMAYFTDPDGNQLGIFQMDSKAM